MYITGFKQPNTEATSLLRRCVTLLTLLPEQGRRSRWGHSPTHQGRCFGSSVQWPPTLMQPATALAMSS